MRASHGADLAHIDGRGFEQPQVLGPPRATPGIWRYFSLASCGKHRFLEGSGIRELFAAKGRDHRKNKDLVWDGPAPRSLSSDMHGAFVTHSRDWQRAPQRNTWSGRGAEETVVGGTRGARVVCPGL